MLVHKIKAIVSRGFIIKLSFLYCIWLLISQAGFYFLQYSSSSQTVKSLEIILRQELDYSNLQYIARSAGDLQYLGLIRCLKIEREFPSPAPIVDVKYMSKDCRVFDWQLQGRNLDVDLKTLNGDIYNFKFISNNDQTFYIALWGLRFLGFIIIVLFLIIQSLQIEKQNMLLEAERKQTRIISDIVMQVAHDIRSPLSLLHAVAQNVMKSEHKEKDLVSMAIERIQEITSDLLSQYRRDDHTNNSSKCFVVKATEEILKEKELQWSQHSQLKYKLYNELTQDCEIEISESLLKRILSNLLNNASESLPNFVGEIDVFLRANRKIVNIIISDNGIGMSEEVQASIGKRQFSHGKKNGLGMGLFHAISSIKEIDGEVNITSALNQGTIITLSLRKVLNN